MTINAQSVAATFYAAFVEQRQKTVKYNLNMKPWSELDGDQKAPWIAGARAAAIQIAGEDKVAAPPDKTPAKKNAEPPTQLSTDGVQHTVPQPKAAERSARG